MKKLLRLPSMSRVQPGSKATLEFPLGATYERVVFTVEAAAGLDATDIGAIEVLFNGQGKIKFKDLQRLLDLNIYYNRGADTVTATKIEFALHFNRAELVDNIMRSAPGVGTADLATMHIEMEINAAAPADIKITAQAQVNPVRQNLGAFFAIREYPTSSNVAGLFEVDKLPRGAYYGALHLFKSDITDVEVVANDVKIIEAKKGILERFQKEASPVKRVPLTAKATHIDFLTDGNLLDALPTQGLQDFRIKMTLGTSGAVDIVAETLDVLA